MTPRASLPGSDAYLVAEATELVAAAQRAPYSAAARRQVVGVLTRLALRSDGAENPDEFVQRVADLVEVLTVIAADYAGRGGH